jgi:hypothetical protein
MSHRETCTFVRFNLLSIFGCVALAGCGPATTEADVAREVFGSTENLNAMKSATKVTACRIEEPPADARGQQTSADEFLAQHLEAKWIELSPTQIDQIQDVLSAPSTYMFGASKECVPRYGVRVRFKRDGDAIDVNLCFDCKQLAVVRRGAIVGEEDFDRANRELVAICKELFPDDSEIQALKP